MADILRFPSRGLPRELGVAFRPDQFGFPCGHIVEVVRLNAATGEHVEALENLAARHLRIGRSFDTTDKALVDANAVGHPRLGATILLSPLSQLHNDTMYVATSYLVNGHGERAGAEYVPVAYVLVMHPGNRLRQVRKAAGLTQEQLAERTGYNQDRISNYENGRRPMRLADMRVLARELGCAVADILEDEDNPERLSGEERRLLEAFRQMDMAGRGFIMTSATAVAGRNDRDAAAA